MDGTAQWAKEEELVKAMEGEAPNTRPLTERRTRPQEHLNCPRCNSTITKFCYYNNYSLTQPRYFCKTCRRYWTEGGSLRNVPVGGGSRKNKKYTPAASTSNSKIPDLNPQSLSQISSQNLINGAKKGHDLNLAFQTYERYHGETQYVEVMPKIESDNRNQQVAGSASSSTPLSALELLRTGIASRGSNTFIPPPMIDSSTLYSSGFPFQEFKPTPGTFSVDGVESRPYGVQENNGGKLLFPFGESKQISTTNEGEQKKGQGSSTGYWSSMLNGGYW
ncbi:hypothetical protein F2P56_014570 [Juglans regia]|uniref:Dof zinc finger protein n=2 Tax=Juglans regia TaxID=51240 RepID=A0A2I4EG13_JUGRE|nr:dof zinc finger protein DOF2.5-like [Juglans regia]KAF5464497.1 hypothetical protein F2P56_014570 [Juglans regia]